MILHEPNANGAYDALPSASQNHSGNSTNAAPNNIRSPSCAISPLFRYEARYAALSAYALYNIVSALVNKNWTLDFSNPVQ